MSVCQSFLSPFHHWSIVHIAPRCGRSFSHAQLSMSEIWIWHLAMDLLCEWLLWVILHCKSSISNTWWKLSIPMRTTFAPFLRREKQELTIFGAPKMSKMMFFTINIKVCFYSQWQRSSIKGSELHQQKWKKWEMMFEILASYLLPQQALQHHHHLSEPWSPDADPWTLDPTSPEDIEWWPFWMQAPILIYLCQPELFFWPLKQINLHLIYCTTYDYNFDHI